MGAGLSLPLPLEELSQNALDGLVFLQIVLELVDFQQPPLPPRDMHAKFDYGFGLVSLHVEPPVQSKLLHARFREFCAS